VWGGTLLLSGSVWPMARVREVVRLRRWRGWRGMSEAEALVRAYQDSPGRTAMLARLGGLHRKP
jgi:hypothetical protein